MRDVSASPRGGCSGPALGVPFVDRIRLPSLHPTTGSVRPAFSCVSCLLCLAGTFFPSDAGRVARGKDTNDWPVKKQHHRWARFGSGAWRTVRVTTETMDESGRVTSTAVTTSSSTLHAVTPTDYTLEMNVTVEVDGRRVNSRSRIVTRRFDGTAEGEKVTVESEGTESLVIENTPVVCDVYVMTVAKDTHRQVTRIHYSQDVAPYILKKSVRSSEPSGDTALDEIDEQVVHRKMPRRFGTKTLTTSVVRTRRLNAKGSTMTLAFRCENVPGSIVDQTSKEKNANGRIVRRSTLELIGYGFGRRPKQRRPAFGGRRRKR